MCLHIDEWRTLFHARHTGGTPKQKNDAFSRVRRSLVSKNLTQDENDIYTLSDKATSGVIHENVTGKITAEATRQRLPFRGVSVSSRMISDQSRVEKDDAFPTLEYAVRHFLRSVGKTRWY